MLKIVDDLFILPKSFGGCLSRYSFDSIGPIMQYGIYTTDFLNSTKIHHISEHGSMIRIKYPHEDLVFVPFGNHYTHIFHPIINYVQGSVDHHNY